MMCNDAKPRIAKRSSMIMLYLLCSFSCPEIVNLCVLPSGHCKNISAHIQQKLIEAFCWENDITIVNVDENALSGLMKSSRSKAVASDLQCVLLTTSKFDPSVLDEDYNDVDGNFG